MAQKLSNVFAQKMTIDSSLLSYAAPTTMPSSPMTVDCHQSFAAQPQQRNRWSVDAASPSQLETSRHATLHCQHCDEGVLLASDGLGPELLFVHELHCARNPDNFTICEHCSQRFTTRFGRNGEMLRDGSAMHLQHERACLKNPGNTLTCEHCAVSFMSTYDAEGRVVNCGQRQLNEHLRSCLSGPTRNPACSFCSTRYPIVYDKSGQNLICDGMAMVAEHARVCAKNPENCFECEHCGNRFQNHFVGGRLQLDGQSLCVAHSISCQLRAEKCSTNNYGSLPTFPMLLKPAKYAGEHVYTQLQKKDASQSYSGGEN